MLLYFLFLIYKCNPFLFFVLLFSFNCSSLYCLYLSDIQYSISNYNFFNSYQLKIIYKINSVSLINSNIKIGSVCFSDIYNILISSLRSYNFNFLNTIYLFFFTIIHKYIFTIYFNFYDNEFFTITWSLSILLNIIQEILYTHYNNFKFFKIYFLITYNNKFDIFNISNKTLEVNFLLNYNKSFYKILYKFKKKKYVLDGIFYGYIYRNNTPYYIDHIFSSDLIKNNICAPIYYINFNLLIKLNNVFFIKHNELITIKKIIAFLNIIFYVNNIILANNKFYN